MWTLSDDSEVPSKPHSRCSSYRASYCQSSSSHSNYDRDDIESILILSIVSSHCSPKFPFLLNCYLYTSFGNLKN